MTTKSKRPAKPETVGKRSRCPICGRPARRETRPFCSQRCAERDLGRWLGGAYRIPTEERPGEVPEEGRSEDISSDDDVLGPSVRRY